MKNESIPFAQQSILPQDIEEVAKALRDPRITRGPKVEEFENAIAAYCSARFAVAFNSATSALHASCFAGEVNKFDRFFTTPNTFIGTVVGCIHCEAKPVFIDICQDTGNFDLELLESKINKPSSRGRDVIMAVHFAGTPVEMSIVDRMIKSPNTLVIEDAAHALGSSYSSGEKVGNCRWSHMTIFSFHPSKTITTLEGGLVTTNDEKLYKRLRLFRDNGIMREFSEPGYYEVQEITGNFHFTDVQGALGLSQLKRLDEIVQKRQHLVSKYKTLFENQTHITLLSSNAHERSSHHLFVIKIDFQAIDKTRCEVMETLKNEGIGTGVHYIPLYRHPYFTKRYGNVKDSFPKMESYYEKTLSLPLYYEMDTETIQKVVETLLRVIHKP